MDHHKSPRVPLLWTEEIPPDPKARGERCAKPVDELLAQVDEQPLFTYTTREGDACSIRIISDPVAADEVAVSIA